MASEDFKIIKFDKFEDFYNYCIFNYPRSKETTKYIFRGQGDDSWHLTPTALRIAKDNKSTLHHFDRIDGKCDNKERFIVREFLALYEFYQTANINGLRIPEVSDFSYIATLSDISQAFDFASDKFRNEFWIPKRFHQLACLAQHYKIPTRLLDWTLDFNIALYFAAKSACKAIYSGAKR